MTRTRLEQLRDYPYRKVAGVLGECTSDLTQLNLSVGEPKFGAYQTVTDALAATDPVDWGKYPPVNAGTDVREAMAGWLRRRYALPDGMLDTHAHVHPVFGTKEGLFSAILTAVLRKEDQLSRAPIAVAGTAPRRPIVVLPNPLYHVYIGAALTSGAEVVFAPCTAATDFAPDLSVVAEDDWDRVALVIATNPGNPTGTLLSASFIRAAIERARAHDFTFLSDECYSELYYEAKPLGALEICRDMGGSLDNVWAVNSLSKRSGLPGLRSGFIAGDADRLEDLYYMRAYGGAQTPVALQEAAVRLWNDETHVEGFRERYAEINQIAREVFGELPGFRAPEAGFVLWQPVSSGDGDRVARRLWQEQAVRTLPGSILSRAMPDGSMPGQSFVRFALIYPADVTREALLRCRDILATDNRH